MKKIKIYILNLLNGLFTGLIIIPALYILFTVAVVLIGIMLTAVTAFLIIVILGNGLIGGNVNVVKTKIKSI